MRGLAPLLAAAIVAGACGGTDETVAPALFSEGGESVPAETQGTLMAPVDSDASGSSLGGDPDGCDMSAGLGVTVDCSAVAAQEEGLEPQRGGTLRVAVEAEADGLNPASSNFVQASYVMAYSVFDPLAYWDTQGNWVPLLAEAFTKIGDGSSWRMTLRDGVKFHDGTSLDADDVIDTFDAHRKDPVNSLVVKSIWDKADPVTKVDDLTVEYRLARPMARFPALLTTWLGMVLPSEWLAAAAVDPLNNQMPVGQGPFIIESRAQHDKTVLVRNPDYWAADRTDIYLDRIEVYPITQGAAAAQRLIAGDLDLVITTDPDATATLRGAARDGITTIENMRSTDAFSLMNTQRPPFDDIRARQALTAATDADALRALNPGASQPSETFFHPDLVWRNTEVTQQTNSAELARDLVDAYCGDSPQQCTDGRIDVQLDHAGPSGEQSRLAAALQTSWRPYFNVTPSEESQADLVTKLATGNYSVANWRGFGEPDPDLGVVRLQCAAIDFVSVNWTRYCDEQRDALMFEAVASSDADRRIELWHRIQERVRDSHTYIFHGPTSWAVASGRHVHSVCGQASPDGAEFFCNNQGRVLLRQIWLS